MKKFLSVAFALFFLTFAQGQEKERYVRITGGPYVTNVTSDGFTVVFTTNIDAVSWVEIAPDDGTHFYNTQREAYYDLRGLGRRPVGRTHKVTVKGLESGTAYRYRAMVKGVLSLENRKSTIYTEGYGTDLKTQPCKVTTLSEDYDRVRFSMVNDLHGNDSVFCRLYGDAKGKYDFVCFNGDMTSSIDRESDIMDCYLRSASRLFGSDTPIVFVRGNHEYRGNDALKWYDYFENPTGRTWNAFSYGDFFFLVLDGGEDKHDSDIRNLDLMRTAAYVQEERTWLEQVVQTDECRNAKVRIAFCHMPPAPDGWYGNAVVSRCLVPSLNKARFDLMLCGHIHKYRLYGQSRETGADFPVVCNANLERMDAEVSSSGITLEFFNAEGGKLRTLSFPASEVSLR